MSIKNIYRNILIMYTLLFSLSCKFLDFTQLELDCSISGNNGYFLEDEIKIDFSLEPKEDSLRELIVLQKDNSSIDFHLRLDGNRALIKPVEQWEKGRSYSVEIHGDLQLAPGGSHSVYFYRNFFYGEENKNFSLLKWTEPGKDEKKSPLVFDFNYPVNTSSFAKNFSLNPQISYDFFLEEDGRRVLVVPQEAWAKNQRFSWAINQLEDEFGYYLDKTYQENFVWNTDTELPDLDEVVPIISPDDSGHFVESQEKRLLFDRQGILLRFSKDMDLNSIKDGISFEPSISGEIQRGPSKREFLWIPEENWALEERYRMIISSDVQDLEGIQLERDEEIFFTVANQFLQVTSIHLGEYNSWEEGDLSEGDIQGVFKSGSNMEIYVKNEGATVITTINFSQPLCLESLQNNLHSITMEPFFPVTASYPILEQVSFDGNRALILHWRGFSVSSPEVNNYYRLKIAGGDSGIKTSVGNYLKEDVWLIIQVLQG